MSYISGCIAAVPAANKEAYREHIASAAALFREFGATRVVEAWGDDVPDGKITDFKGAVQAGSDEVVVFSWHEFPSKAAAEMAQKKFADDPRVDALGASVPYDTDRMIFAGFATIAEKRAPGKAGYVDGSLIAVPAANKAAYEKLVAQFNEVLMEHGAVRVLDAWEDQVSDDMAVGLRRSVKAGDDEKIVYSWVEWPSKAVRDAGWEKVIADPRMYPDEEPYDNSRRIYGGFAPILDA